jgi:dihydrodipicolinate synthase/N-acetylneuraminate lyase
VNFLPESINELLQKVGNIAAMKEASGDITQMMRLVELCGDRITLLSGMTIFFCRFSQSEAKVLYQFFQI